MEELRSVAVGEDEGGLHGYTLEFLESRITTLEDELVELDRSENVARLKSLVANSQQGGQDQPNGPPFPFFTNLHRAIAAGEERAGPVETALTGRIQKPLGHGCYPGDQRRRSETASQLRQLGESAGHVGADDKSSKWASKGSYSDLWQQDREG